MNKINYNEVMKGQLDNVSSDDVLLLHTCCAPCLTHSLVVFLQYFERIVVYYSNNNITDLTEWNKRLAEIVRLVDIVNKGEYVVQSKQPIKVVTKPLCTTDYFDCVEGFEGDREGGQRCNLCYNMRLEDSYNYAKSKGYPFYTTTLTISPYKNSNWLNTIGMCYSDDTTKYLCCDLKKNDGYKHSIQLSTQYAIYRQHYCGCPFSLQD